MHFYGSKRREPWLFGEPWTARYVLQYTTFHTILMIFQLLHICIYMVHMSNQQVHTVRTVLTQMMNGQSDDFRYYADIINPKRSEVLVVSAILRHQLQFA
jgi:hypothetical protein